MLRIYVRTRLVKAFGYDDWFMVAALLSHIGFAVSDIVLAGCSTSANPSVSRRAPLAAFTGGLEDI